MPRPLLKILPLASVAALIATAGFAEPTTQLLANTCAICHGSFDPDVQPAEEDDDFKPEKFIEEMREIKAETGKGRIMSPITYGLTDQQILALADYLRNIRQ